MKHLLLIATLTLGSLIVGCGKQSADQAVSPQQQQAEAEAQRAAFEEQRQEQEAEAKRQAELAARSREFVEVTFTGINEKGYPMVNLVNQTEKDIQSISGAFKLEDPAGNVLVSTGLTIQQPAGQTYLPVGEPVEQSPYGLNRKEDVMETLKANPDEISFWLEANSITYTDGTEEAALK